MAAELGALQAARKAHHGGAQTRVEKTNSIILSIKIHLKGLDKIFMATYCTLIYRNRT